MFDCQLANLAQQPPTDADTARLPHVSDLLRQKLQESGKFDVVPITPQVKAEVDKASELRSCGGSARSISPKSSTQSWLSPARSRKSQICILNINVYMKEVGSDKPETATSVDIRGDNDLSFDHGVKYLVKNNILKESEAGMNQRARYRKLP